MTDYLQKWQDFRGLRRNMIFLAAVGFFGMTGAMFLKPIFPTMKLFTPMNFALAMMLWMNWIILVVSLEGRIASWPCPRCEKAFCGGRAALREARSWSLAPAQCTNCGLPGMPKLPAHNLHRNSVGCAQITPLASAGHFPAPLQLNP